MWMPKFVWFRRMCDSGEGGFFPNSLFCDQNEDCTDGSDEVGCGVYIYLNVPVTMGAAALALALLYFLDLGIELYLKTRTVSISALQTLNLVVLRLPHLEDLARNFPQILSEATFEMILFNDDHCYFFQFLDIIRLHNFSPECQYKLLQTFFAHLKKTYRFPDDDTIFTFLRQKYGATSSMRILLDSRNFPGTFDTLRHSICDKVLNLPTTLRNLVNFWRTSLNIGLLIWDFIKDVAFYFILSNIYWNGGADKSPMEEAIIHIILASFLTSQFISGLFSFYHRRNWLNVEWSTRWEQIIFDIFLLVISPVLPYVKMLKVSKLKNKLTKLEVSFIKSETSVTETVTEMARVQENLVDLEDEVTSVCVLDACLESIINCSCLMSLIVFYDLNLYTATGRYYYHDNLAQALLSRGNWSDTLFFLGGIITSILAAAGKFTLYSNWCNRGAFSLGQKISSMFFFFLVILARVWSLVVSIHLSSLNFVNTLQTHEYQERADRSEQLSKIGYRLEFLTYRPRQFEMLKDTMIRNITITITVYAIHLVITFLHSYVFILSFKRASLRKQLLNLLANLFVPLPFSDSYQTPPRQSLLVSGVHGLENVLLFYLCLLASPHDQVDRVRVNQLVFVMPMVAANIAALLLLFLNNRFLSDWAFLNNSTWITTILPKALPTYSKQSLK